MSMYYICEVYATKTKLGSAESCKNCVRVTFRDGWIYGTNDRMIYGTIDRQIDL